MVKTHKIDRIETHVYEMSGAFYACLFLFEGKRQIAVLETQHDSNQKALIWIQMTKEALSGALFAVIDE